MRYILYTPLSKTFLFQPRSVTFLDAGSNVTDVCQSRFVCDVSVPRAHYYYSPLSFSIFREAPIEKIELIYFHVLYFTNSEDVSTFEDRFHSAAYVFAVLLLSNYVDMSYTRNNIARRNVCLGAYVGRFMPCLCRNSSYQVIRSPSRHRIHKGLSPSFTPWVRLRHRTHHRSPVVQ